MKPITRKEYYLAKAAGTYTGPTPPPVLREDYYLATLAGDYSGNCPAPVTRIEKYMSAAAGLTTYVPQPVTRVEKYWYAIAKGTGYVPEPVTREERFLYALVPNKPGPPKPEYVDKTAEGNPILLTDSAEAPLTALTVYGYSTQSGTPSPENPVPIVSAGSVMTTGAQLFDIQKATAYNSTYGLSISIDGETIKISGVTSNIPDNNSASFRILSYPENLYGNRFSMDIVDSTGAQGSYVYASENENALAINFNTSLGAEVNLVFRLMVNSGSEALPWEPYTGGVPGVNPYAGEINVNVGGKNLVPFPYLSPLGGAGTVYEADGVTYTVQADGGIKCVGIPMNIFGPTLCRIRFSETQMNTTANDSGSATDGEVTLSGGPLYFDSNNNATFIYWESRVDTPVDMTIYPQVEYGTVATAYEPYKTPQTLTLSTPGGLPGIPVSSGGNYTDENGQQWVCDEIDLKRGKYVKRVKSVTFDGSENWEISSSDEENQYFKCDSTKPDYTEGDPNMAGLSSMVKVVRYDRIDIYGDNDVISWIFYWRLRLSNLDISAGATVDDLKQFLASNPITVYYTSLTPIETDLPAEEIAAYKALHTYSPNTSVSNDAEAWMKVGYKATP